MYLLVYMGLGLRPFGFKPVDVRRVEFSFDGGCEVVRSLSSQGAFV